MKYTLKEQLGFYIYWLKHLFCKHYWITDISDGATFKKCSFCGAILELFPKWLYRIYLRLYVEGLIKEFKRRK
jgi:hypothetical protein